MEEQEGKTWKGTASDLYNRLKEIIGEATGAEPTDEQLASTLWPFGIEITRHKRSGGSPHLKIYARPESARRIAPICAQCSGGRGKRDDGLRHNTPYCARRIRGWRRKRAQWAQWAQFHGLFPGDR